MAKGDRPSDSSGSDQPPRDLRRERTYRFESPGYDVDKFYLKSKDDPGHSEWMKLRVPPDLYDRARAVIGKDSGFPYRSFSDLARDALFHRLKHLTDQLPSQRPAFDALTIDLNFAEFLATERHGRAWVKTICEEIDSIVADYSRRQQLDVALEKLLDWLDKLPGREEAHHVYVEQYIKQRIAEVRRRMTGGDA